MTPVKTSWMWPDEQSGGVMGATIDLDDQTILWFDQPGCACGGSDAGQAFTDYLERGPRGLMPPADVRDEIRDVIVQQLATAKG